MNPPGNGRRNVDGKHDARKGELGRAFTANQRPFHCEVAIVSIRRIRHQYQMCVANLGCS